MMWWLPAFVVLAIIGAAYVATVLLLVVVAVVNPRRSRYRDTWMRVDLTPRGVPPEDKP